MSKSKKIQIIHAADANQHLGHIQKILDTFKEEKRISSYTAISSDAVTENSFNDIGDKDMVIMLLTNDILDHKASIEALLLDLKKKQPEARCAGVIVDNVTYDPSFIAFPSNLEPIRASADMDTVWKGIAEKLKLLFPKPADPIVPPPPPPITKPGWKKWLPYIFGIVALLAIFLVFRKCIDTTDDDVTPPPLHKVVGVSTTVNAPRSYVGDCPHKFTFEGKIKVTGPTTVKYTWVGNDNTFNKVDTLIFTQAGEKSIPSRTWSFGAAGQDLTGYKQIKILSPNEMLSEKANFKLSCKKPPTRTSGSFTVRQTWSGDFDLRREVPSGASASQKDFWFEARTATNRAIVPQNNAKLSYMNAATVPTFEQVKYAVTNRSQSEIQVSRLRPGRWMGFRTANGNYVTFTVTHAVGPSPGLLRLRYYYWRE